MEKNICGIEVEIIRKKIKNIYVKIDEKGEAALVLPYFVDLSDGEKFFASKIDLIMKRVYAAKSAPKSLFKDGEGVFLFGEKRTLKIEISTKAEAFESGEIFCVRAKDEQKARLCASAYLKKRLNEVAAPFFDKWEKALGVKAQSVSIRKTTSRWGSCSPNKKTIRLSLYLASFPTEIIEYVVLHELLHIIYPNHGVGFKKALDGYMPNWRSFRRFLNANGEKMRINL